MAYAHIWALDFEFRAPPGENPEVVCMCATDAVTGRRMSLWGQELQMCPFRTDESSLFVAYFASAEISCFLALGWPLPARILDLYTEFRVLTNGGNPASGNGLLGAMTHFGLTHMAPHEKEDMRTRILAGAPWSGEDRENILAYCMEDVDAVLALLAAMEHEITRTPVRFCQALFRGRYMTAVAAMEHVGVPIDTEMLCELRTHWETIQRQLIEEVDVAYGLYQDGHFREARFLEMVRSRGYAWPQLMSGDLRLDAETFRTMAGIHPELEPLRQLRNTLGELRLQDLAVGRDGRNRTLLSPFRAKTGRNAPSSSRFVFGPATWSRFLIKPEPESALAYIDWSSQEVGIAAALSGDERMLEAVRSGDPYMAFAITAGLAPEGATKSTHPHIRDRVKACLLGVNYGMGASTLAVRLGISQSEARQLLRLYDEAYPTFAKWREDHLNRSLLGFAPTTLFGWTLEPDEATKPTTLRNFPIQATGAELLRLACSLGIERGIQICCPIHDAVLVEASCADGIEETVCQMQNCMAEASRALLDGLEIKTDVKVIKAPNRFEDDRRKDLFGRITKVLVEVRDRTTKGRYLLVLKPPT